MLWTGQWMSKWEMYVCHTIQIGSTINSQSNFLLSRLMVCEKIWSRYSSEQPYLFCSIKEEEVFLYWVYFNIFCGLSWGFKSWTRRALRFQTVHELVVSKWNEIFCFLVTKVTWYFCFSQGANSIRGHASLLLVLRKCFRGDENILIWKSSNIYISKSR